MIIYFSQGLWDFDPIALASKGASEAALTAARAVQLPVYPRCSLYEGLLAENPSGVFWTTDENLVLVAQWLRRTGAIARLQLVSVEAGTDGLRYARTIEVDEEGDFSEDVPLGFFTQRMKYLR